jgi:hypothetical protein
MATGDVMDTKTPLLHPETDATPETAPDVPSEPATELAPSEFPADLVVAPIPLGVETALQPESAADAEPAVDAEPVSEPERASDPGPTVEAATTIEPAAVEQEPDVEPVSGVEIEAGVESAPSGDAESVPAEVPTAEQSPIDVESFQPPAVEADESGALVEEPPRHTAADDVVEVVAVEELSPAVEEAVVVEQPVAAEAEAALVEEPPVEAKSAEEPSVEPTLADGAVPGAEWATIDEDGNVRQKDGDLYTGRVVGRITGANPAVALAFYAREFDQFAERAKTLEAEARTASNPAAFFGRIQRLLEQIPTIDGIGDFDGLIRGLNRLEADLKRELDRRREVKERLAARAEELATSTDWKATGDELRAMFEEWKGVGTVGRDHEQTLWERFNTARQAFYAHREAHFAERDRERQANQARKEELCLRAEALQDSTDWKGTSDALKALQAEWKVVGTAGREQDQALWGRFRGAMDVFFQNRAGRFAANKQTKLDLCAAVEALQDSTDWTTTSATLKGLQEQWKQVGFAGGDEDDALWARFRRALDVFYNARSEVFAERDRVFADNLRQKEALVAEAEALLAAGDLRSGTARVKFLQEQWKTIGPVPRERAEPIWQRFRAACDGIFDGAREEREHRQTLWRSNLKESLERQRAFAKELMEAIGRDDELLERWQNQLDSLRPGGREPEIRKDLEDKIASANGRIQNKQTRFEEVLASIAELEARLTAEASR